MNTKVSKEEFPRLVRQHAAAVINLTARLLPDRWEAEEVAQDAMGYLEVKGEAGRDFEAETTLHHLRPGRYRVSAVVRAAEAEHSFAYVFARTGDTVRGDMSVKEIPAKGNTGGNVWFSALCRFEQRAADKSGVYVLDINKATANGGLGYGWNRIWLDDVTVYADGALTYGVTTRSTPNYNGNRFSACDFTVERIGD